MGTILGGSSASVISPYCTFSATIVAPQNADPYEIFVTARDVVSRYPEARFEWEGTAAAEMSDPNHEMALILQDTVENLGRARPELTPAIAISDCRYWRYRGTPAFWYGPNGDRCSAADEFVSIDELLHTVKTHAIAAAQYLLRVSPDVQEQMSPLSLEAKSPVIRTVPAMRVARISVQVKSYNEVDNIIEPMLGELYRGLIDAGVSVSDVALSTFEPVKGGIQVSVAFPVGESATSGERFEVVDLPALEQAAVAVHRGPNSTSAAWSKLRPWIRKQGFKAEEVYREVYVVGTPNPKELWATELQQMITPLHKGILRVPNLRLCRTSYVTPACSLLRATRSEP